MPLRAVLFDMDGVIIDSEPEYFRIEMELINKLSIPFSENDQRSYMGINPINMWHEIVEKFNLSKTADELYAIEAKMVENYYAHGQLKGITATLDLIKQMYDCGCKCAVASSSEKRNIYHVLNRLKIRGFFKVIVSNDDVENCKPMPDIYILAAEKLNVTPTDCIVIEDSIPGVMAAKAAGMKVIRFQSNGADEKDKQLADRVVCDIREITISILEDIMRE